MAAISRRCAEARRALVGAAAVAVGSASLAGGTAAREPLVDAPPVWYDDDARDIPKPQERDPSIAWEGIQSSMVRAWGRGIDPIRLVRCTGTIFGRDHVPMAANVNGLGEVPSSTWFTNRIGLRPLPPAGAARGPGGGTGPDPRPPWTVVRAKTQGITPGFTIEDSRGDRWLVKFDPPGFRCTSTAAGVVTNRILWAAGYNVPDDNVTYFRREQLMLGPKVKMPDEFGQLRPMTQADLDAILDRVEPDRGAPLRAITSKFLSGVPVGPFDQQGRREDDPNDRIDHQDRRELRGLREIASWLNHFDLKQQNSLDMWVEEDGRHFVRHYLIDFASTLGTGATGPVPVYGYEYQVDAAAIFGRLFTLGLREDPWRRLRLPGVPGVGYLENEVYQPEGFKPQHHHSAFANTTDRDSYWAAKIISAFTDEHLRAIVDAARYESPAAAEYVTRLLAARRDRIARHWFDRVPPLDFFRPDGTGIRYSDLGAERGVYPGTTPRYRFRCAPVDANRSPDRWSSWQESAETFVPLDEGAAVDAQTASTERYPFLALECRVSRGNGWSEPVTAYVARASRRIVAVDR